MCEAVVIASSSTIYYCRDGTRKKATDYRNCYLGKVKANAVVTNPSYSRCGLIINNRNMRVPTWSKFATVTQEPRMGSGALCNVCILVWLFVRNIQFYLNILKFKFIYGCAVPTWMHSSTSSNTPSSSTDKRKDSQPCAKKIFFIF
jgi:hypothetical protein